MLRKAASMGLTVTDSFAGGGGNGDSVAAISRQADSDVVNIKGHLPMDFRQVLYRSADVVLANGEHESFGGLEAMASSGVVLTGATGEDYAIHNHNCVVQETGDSSELVSSILHLRNHPSQAERIRKAARNSAKLFTWEKIVEDLIRKVEQQAGTQGALRQRHY